MVSLARPERLVTGVNGCKLEDTGVANFARPIDSTQISNRLDIYYERFSVFKQCCLFKALDPG